MVSDPNEFLIPGGWTPLPSSGGLFSTPGSIYDSNGNLRPGVKMVSPGSDMYSPTYAYNGKTLTQHGGDDFHEAQWGYTADPTTTTDGAAWIKAMGGSAAAYRADPKTWAAALASEVTPDMTTEQAMSVLGPSGYGLSAMPKSVQDAVLADPKTYLMGLAGLSPTTGLPQGAALFQGQTRYHGVPEPSWGSMTTNAAQGMGGAGPDALQWVPGVGIVRPAAANATVKKEDSGLGAIAPIAGLALGIAAPGLGSALGSSLLGSGASAIASSALGNAIIGGTLSGLSGGDPLTGALAGGVGAGLGGSVSNLTGSSILGGLAGSAGAQLASTGTINPTNLLYSTLPGIINQGIAELTSGTQGASPTLANQPTTQQTQGSIMDGFQTPVDYYTQYDPTSASSTTDYGSSIDQMISNLTGYTPSAGIDGWLTNLSNSNQVYNPASGATYDPTTGSWGVTSGGSSGGTNWGQLATSALKALVGGSGGTGSASGGGASNLANLLNLISGGMGIVSGLNQSNFDPNAYASRVGAMADPFGSQRSQYNAPLQQAIQQQGTTDPLAQLRGIMSGDFTKDPGYQFRLQQGLQGVDRTMAAKGMGLSGNELLALQEQGQGLASQEYGNAFQRALQQQQLVTNQQNNQLATLMQATGASNNPASGANAYANAMGQGLGIQQSGQNAVMQGMQGVATGGSSILGSILNAVG